MGKLIWSKNLLLNYNTPNKNGRVYDEEIFKEHLLILQQKMLREQRIKKINKIYDKIKKIRKW